jgi:hypothetical protein
VLIGYLRQRPQPRAEAAGKDNAFHFKRTALRAVLWRSAFGSGTLPPKLGS